MFKKDKKALLATVVNLFFVFMTSSAKFHTDITFKLFLMS